MPDLSAAEPSFDLLAAPAQERAAPRMYVKQSDIDKYGKTLTCPGCDSAGTNRWGRHTDDCRERFRRLMQSDEDGRARLAREQAREDRLFDKETAKAVNLDPNIRKAEQEHDDALKNRGQNGDRRS